MNIADFEKSLHDTGYCEFQDALGFTLILIDYIADDELNEPYGVNFIKINDKGIYENDFFTYSTLNGLYAVHSEIKPLIAKSDNRIFSQATLI